MKLRKLAAGLMTGAMVASMWAMPAMAEDDTVTETFTNKIEIAAGSCTSLDLSTYGKAGYMISSITMDATANGLQEFKTTNNWTGGNGSIGYSTYSISEQEHTDATTGAVTKDHFGWLQASYEYPASTATSNDFKVTVDFDLTDVCGQDITDDGTQIQIGWWWSASNESLTINSLEITYVASKHNVDTKVVNDKAATCTEAGYTGDTICAGCTMLVTAGTEIPALGHTWVDATCTTPKTCSVCSETEGEALGHDWVLQDDGTYADCSRCGVPYCDHVDKGTEVKDAKAATCTEAGYTGDTYCKNCGEMLEAGSEIAALGHTAAADKANVKAATCTEAGYTGDTVCSVCGEVIEKGSEVAATGHTYVDGKCSVCGEADPTAKSADVAPIVALFAMLSVAGVAMVSSKKRA